MMASPAKKTRSRLLVVAILVALVAGGAVAGTLVIRHRHPQASAVATAGSADVVVAPHSPDAGTATVTAKPAPTPPPTTPFAPDATGITLGAAVAAPIGDFWSWPRSDGTVLVTSPLIDAIFPAQPTFELKPGVKTKDGRATEVYNITLQDKAHILNIQVVALGRGARDDGAVSAMETSMKKLGPVTTTTRVESSQTVTRLVAVEPSTATTEDSRMIVDARIDTTRGLFVYATADTVPSYNALGDAFLDHVHLRPLADATTDPSTLTGIRIRKNGKQFEAHDKGDNFTIDMPWMADVVRTVDAANSVVHVAVTAIKGKATILVNIDEKAAWDALGITPTVVDGLAADDRTWAAKQKHVWTHLTWNRFQHRLYRVSCTGTPCDAVSGSLHFADPAPTK
jgi:hypothetical protein